MQALVVAEQLNFHRAAEILGISQSMISSRLMVLEDALCIPLSPVLFDLGASAQHSTK
ncbi:helix-turn-helix domain-containing protein [Acetobacter syzygii]|uniref:helix-turn-helix domain-containing protein n=1 Tax=Acetobacter syzygii TaxID=146476 RepID=UPI001C2D617A